LFLNFSTFLVLIAQRFLNYSNGRAEDRWSSQCDGAQNQSEIERRRSTVKESAKAQRCLTKLRRWPVAKFKTATPQYEIRKDYFLYRPFKCCQNMILQWCFIVKFSNFGTKFETSDGSEQIEIKLFCVLTSLRGKA
jgi:hypothetical protein